MNANSHEPLSEAATPTVVLVHGAFAESASWNGVIADLHGRGYKAIAVANPLRGLQQDAAYLRSVLDSLSGPVVVAGHSYGGSVMSEAADGAAGVKALVYVASFNLEVGESTAELAAKFPGGELGPALDSVPFPLPGRRDRHGPVHPAGPLPRGVRRRRRAGRRRADGGHAATDRRLRAGGRRHQRRPGRRSRPGPLVTTQDLAIPAESMRFMAARAGSTTVEIDASHAVTVSQPGAVAELIDGAARATVGTDLTRRRRPCQRRLSPTA